MFKHKRNKFISYTTSLDLVGFAQSLHTLHFGIQLLVSASMVKSFIVLRETYKGVTMVKGTILSLLSDPDVGQAAVAEGNTAEDRLAAGLLDGQIIKERVTRKVRKIGFTYAIEETVYIVSPFSRNLPPPLILFVLH